MKNYLVICKFVYSDNCITSDMYDIYKKDPVNCCYILMCKLYNLKNNLETTLIIKQKVNVCIFKKAFVT